MEHEHEARVHEKKPRPDLFHRGREDAGAPNREHGAERGQATHRNEALNRWIRRQSVAPTPQSQTHQVGYDSEREHQTTERLRLEQEESAEKE